MDQDSQMMNFQQYLTQSCCIEILAVRQINRKLRKRLLRLKEKKQNLYNLEILYPHCTKLVSINFQLNYEKAKLIKQRKKELSKRIRITKLDKRYQHFSKLRLFNQIWQSSLLNQNQLQLLPNGNIKKGDLPKNKRSQFQVSKYSKLFFFYLVMKQEELDLYDQIFNKQVIRPLL